MRALDTKLAGRSAVHSCCVHVHGDVVPALLPPCLPLLQVWGWLGTALPHAVSCRCVDAAAACPGARVLLAWLHKRKCRFKQCVGMACTLPRMQHPPPLTASHPTGPPNCHSACAQRRLTGAPGFNSPSTHAQGLTLPFFLLVACAQVPMHVVIGRPIQVPTEADPSQETVQRYLQQYIAAIEGLFERYKAAAGHADATLTVY